MEKFALILAGGNGSRLWPISTQKIPKQFLKLYNDEIMINETIKRVEKLYDYKNIFVIINEKQKNLAYRYIDYKVPRENIIIEPVAKNTAMCIFYSTIKIRKIRGEGIITVLSSDHYIKENNKLSRVLEKTIKLAQKHDNLVTIGIIPSYPATGFGYIKYLKDKKDRM